MKNKILHLKDSIWMSSLSTPMPQELRDLIYDENANEQEKFEAIKSWRASKISAAELEDAEAAQAIYDAHKMEDSTFISATVFLPSENGVINCRHPITLEHHQIRF